MKIEFDTEKSYKSIMSGITHKSETTQETIDQEMIQLMQANIDMQIPRGFQDGCIVMLRELNPSPGIKSNQYSWRYYPNSTDSKEIEYKEGAIKFMASHPESVLKGFSDPIPEISSLEAVT